MTAADLTFQVAVVGDVHDEWGTADAAALGALNVDLALFVGDFGNEAVSIVESVTQLPLPLAVSLGNHDAWYSATAWGRKKCPYDRSREDRVQAQLEALGEAHVGYRCQDFPQFRCSVVGGRPFSWGGSDWKYADFYAERFGVESLAASGDRIAQAARSALHPTLIFLAHNGPTGLGDAPEAPCGKDWKPIGGDHGDPDLRWAIQQSKARGQAVALVTFGHMHHRLRHTQTQLRQRLYQDADGTIYLNAACVPRGMCINGVDCRQFSLVTFSQGQVLRVTSAWVTETGAIAAEELLYLHNGQDSSAARSAASVQIG